MPSLTTVFGFAASIVAVQGLGINCRGSSNCGLSGSSLNTIADYICQISDSGFGRHYDNGQQVTCDGNVCAFFQNTASGGDTALACAKARDLQDHGCGTCGSCPTLPGNDVSTGQLTVNFVSDVHPVPPY